MQHGVSRGVFRGPDRCTGAVEPPPDPPTPPTFQAAGTAVDWTAGGTAINWPTHEVGDIAILFAEIQTTGGGLSTANGFVELPDSPLASTAGTLDTTLRAFWCRATSTTMAAPLMGATTNHGHGVILTFRGCIATGNPYDVTAGDVTTVDDTAVTIPGDTTTTDGCLVVAAVSHGIDTAAAQVSSGANASLESCDERYDAGTVLGNGGGLAVFTGVKLLAGAVAATTATLAGSSGQSRFMVALKPVPSA